MEIWLAITGYEGLYEVSNEGRVRSLARTMTRGGKPYRVKEKILKATVGTVGYPVVNLSKNGEIRQLAVHQIVAVMFLGPCPPGQEVRHGDGVRTNPRLDNLSYGTRLENVADAIAHGTHIKGERVGSAKLTEKQVLEIRSRVAAEGPMALAREFGVSHAQIIDIREGRKWAWLKGTP